MFDVIYYNREDFIKDRNVIHLKEYRDYLDFYVPFDSGFEAAYSLYGNSVSLVGPPTNQSFGVFSNHGQLTGTATYNSNNFYNILTDGTIQFRLKAGFNNAYTYQAFNMVYDEEVAPTPGNYSLKISYNGVDLGHFTIAVLVTDLLDDIIAKVIVAINTAEVMAIYADPVLRIEGKNKGIPLLLSAPTNGDSSLITLLGGVDDVKALNAPTAPVTLFSLKNISNNNNAITLTHNTDGTLQLRMYNGSGSLIVNSSLDWDNYPTEWYAFAISFNATDVKIYIDGVLKSFATTGFSRSFSDNQLVLTGTADNYHLIDELILSSSKLFDASTYVVETTALSKYSILNPYVDVEFGKGYNDNEVSDLNLSCSDNCKFVVKLGEVWYYYLNNSWVVSDGTYAKSISASILSTKFEELYFTEEKFITIRTYFNSDGSTDCWLEELEIVFNTENDASAIISGNIVLSGTYDLSTNKNILIVTDQGMLEVDLTSTAINPAAVSVEEILSAINNANVPGLETATISTDGYLTLTSSNTGTSAFISVQEPQSGSAVSTIWGTLQSDYGESNMGRVFDYEEIFRYTRSMLGAPQVPVELTDEQLNDSLSAAVFEYNRWRNVNENIMTLDLVGDGTAGYEIPAAVGGINNIIDILVQPRTGLVFGNVTDDLMSNIYTQFFFRGAGNFVETAADYYLTLSAQKDIDIIMGTTIQHYFYNNRLWLFPLPTTTMKVAIRYRSTLTPEEIVYNQQIRDLVVAKAKIVLGGIRSTFGGRIPMGDSEIMLNGELMKGEGKEEWASTIDFIRKTQPVEFIIG